MKIEIKKSTKPVEYKEAIDFLEKRLVQINQKKETELIWILEHPNIYTAGTSYNENEILDKSINVIKTNRGGKITYHGPGQTICYFVIDLNKRKKDIRKFTTTIENIIIQTLKEYQINSFNDQRKDNNQMQVVNDMFNDLNDKPYDKFINKIDIIYNGVI